MDTRLTIQKAPFTTRDGRTVDAERGTLEVPMRRSGGPDTTRVRLAFVRLRSASASPAEPVIFLAGGPGMSGIQAGRGRLLALFEALRARHDVILLDQRGCGESTPRLDCTAGLRLPRDRAVTRYEVLAATRDAARACAHALKSQGIDPAAFNTVESADDVADLIAALGGADARAALLAWSYGTHLALAVMRRHPERVTRAILAGPEGPDHTYKLPSRIQRQLSDIAALSETPGLVEALRSALVRLDAEPARVTARDRAGGERSFVVGRFDLEWIVSEGLGDSRFVRRLPRWAAAWARGDFSSLSDALLTGGYDYLHDASLESLLRVCVDCASGATDARRARIQRELPEALLGNTIDFPFPDICDDVGAAELGDDFRAVQPSDVPVLFITGTLDCRTPAENVADLAPAFANHDHVVIENAGHGDLLLPRTVHRVIAAFAAGENVRATRVELDEPFTFERPRPLLLYDGACSFCRAQVERLRVRTGDAVEYAPYQSAPDTGVAREQLASAVHVVSADGNVTRGAEAIFTALAARTGSHPLLWAYRRLPGFAALAEAGYRLVARNRGLFS